MVRKVLYGLLCFGLSSLTLAQNDMRLYMEPSVVGNELLIDVMVQGQSEEFVLGSSNFPFSISGNGFDATQALRVEGEDGRFSPSFDPASYQQLELTNPGFLHLYLLRSEAGSGEGQVLGSTSEKLAQVKIPIEDPCGAANLEWITDRGGISSFDAKRPNVNASYENPGLVHFTEPVEPPEVTNSDQLLSVKESGHLSYQWYKDEVAIPGATAAQFFAETPGDYTVEVSNGCETLVSDPEVIDLITEVHELDAVQLDVVAYPNPYDAQTLVTYRVPSTADVKLEIIDEKGVLVQTLVHSMQAPGAYEVQFSAQEAGFAPGVYFAKLTSGNDVKVERLVELSYK